MPSFLIRVTGFSFIDMQEDNRYLIINISQGVRCIRSFSKLSTKG